MSEEWRVGDLALCVMGIGSGGPNDYTVPPADGHKSAKIGGIYQVEYIVLFHGRAGLVLEGHHSSHPTHSWDASCFRKIHPHTPDAEDEETIRLMREKPAIRPIPAGQWNHWSLLIKRVK